MLEQENNAGEKQTEQEKGLLETFIESPLSTTQINNVIKFALAYSEYHINDIFRQSDSIESNSFIDAFITLVNEKMGDHPIPMASIIRGAMPSLDFDTPRDANQPMSSEQKKAEIYKKISREVSRIACDYKGSLTKEQSTQHDKNITHYWIFFAKQALQKINLKDNNPQIKKLVQILAYQLRHLAKNYAKNNLSLDQGKTKRLAKHLFEHAIAYLHQNNQIELAEAIHNFLSICYKVVHSPYQLNNHDSIGTCVGKIFRDILLPNQGDIFKNVTEDSEKRHLYGELQGWYFFKKLIACTLENGIYAKKYDEICDEYDNLPVPDSYKQKLKKDHFSSGFTPIKLPAKNTQSAIERKHKRNTISFMGVNDATRDPSSTNFTNSRHFSPFRGSKEPLANPAQTEVPINNTAASTSNKIEQRPSALLFSGLRDPSGLDSSLGQKYKITAFVDTVKTEEPVKQGGVRKSR